MKKISRILSLVLALVMVFGLATTAFAQDVASGAGGSATITVANAAKGETYSVVKLFDASVTGQEDGSIVYTGTIPTELSAYFELENGYVVAVEESLSEDAIKEMAEWAKTQSPVASAVSDGSDLTFTGLTYGYYIVTTTQGAAITVDSTNPNAVVYDKNVKEPDIVKSVDDPDVYIGQTVTYTATAVTSNYLGTGADSEIVTQYVIEDTLPAFLTDVVVTKITIDGQEYTVEGEVPKFAEVEGHDNLAIVIPWAVKDSDGKYVSLYKNGAEIVVTYTAKVTNKATVDGTTGNINVVTLTAYTTFDDTTPPDPWEEKWDDEEVIFTYATALQKVDENKKPLAGAKFAANGLTVEKTADGVYTVTAYDPASTEPGTEMECDSEGQLVILGIPSDVTLVITETEAPAGYNKLVGTVNLPAVKTGEEIKSSSATIYYDENGNVTEEITDTKYEKITYNVSLLKKAIVVENKKGTELPSTGGMGTTIFYIVGGILVLAAVVLLVTRKRMKYEA